MNNLAVISGNGSFPFYFLKEVKKRGADCIVVALKGETNPDIEKLGFPVFWCNIGKLNTLISLMKNNKISRAIMCGQVVHTKLFTEIKLDLRAVKLLSSLKNKKTDSILSAVADELEKEGIKLISSLTFMQDWLPDKKGLLTNNKLSKAIYSDIDFGYQTAKAIAKLDIGQTVVVKNNAVVAVESLEGTDQCILRGYDLVGEGIVVVKVNKPDQDIRFDVPVIGGKTFEILKKVKASAIAFESGKTLFFDIKECLEIAEKNNIGVYAI
ncbi:LpxI family protein [bacterium]